MTDLEKLAKLYIESKRYLNDLKSGTKEHQFVVDMAIGRTSGIKDSIYMLMSVENLLDHRVKHSFGREVDNIDDVEECVLCSIEAFDAFGD